MILTTRYIYIPSHLLSSLFYSPSLVVTQIRGHIAGSSSPLPTTVRFFHFFARRFQLFPRRLASNCMNINIIIIKLTDIECWMWWTYCFPTPGIPPKYYALFGDGRESSGQRKAISSRTGRFRGLCSVRTSSKNKKETSFHVGSPMSRTRSLSHIQHPTSHLLSLPLSIYPVRVPLPPLFYYYSCTAHS